MDQKIGEKDLDTITRWLAQEIQQQKDAGIDTHEAYQRAKRKERDWKSGLFRAGLGAGLVVVALIEDSSVLSLLLGLIGAWLMVGGGLATSGEYNDTMEQQGPALARFLAAAVGIFRPKRGNTTGRPPST